MSINASNGRWVAQSREQRAFRSGGLSHPHIRLRLFCIPPASPVHDFIPEKIPTYAVGRFPQLTGVLLNAQAGTGAWIFQSWWKSLPAFVEVSYS